MTTSMGHPVRNELTIKKVVYKTTLLTDQKNGFVFAKHVLFNLINV